MPMSRTRSLAVRWPGRSGDSEGLFSSGAAKCQHIVQYAIEPSGSFQYLAERAAISWRSGRIHDARTSCIRLPRARMNENTIVAMIATQGVEDFLQNALLSLQASGIDTRIVHVARPDNGGELIDPILRRFGAHAISLDGFCDVPVDSFPRQYAEYGSREFVAINWAKLRYLLSLLEQHRHVVYADVDVAWLGDPLWYLQSIARYSPLAFQTEAIRQFPPGWCW